jgi:hypothetical protein
MASIAFCELPDLESLSICPSTAGTICQETPQRSVSQPQGPFSPPSDSRSQSSSISSCVWHVTISEKPTVNEKLSPPSKAKNSRPLSSNVAFSRPPFGIGLLPSLRTMLTMREFGMSET